MSTHAPRQPSAAARVERLVERAMTFAVEEYDDDLAVARLACSPKTTMPPTIRPATSA